MAKTNRKAAQAASQAGAPDAPANPAGEVIPGTITAAKEAAPAAGGDGSQHETEGDALSANPGDDAGTNTSESGSTSGGGIGRAPAAGDGALDTAADATAAVAARLLDVLPPPIAARCHVANWSHLQVRARRPPGIRRAGRFWPHGESVTVFADHFTDEQIEALLTEPALHVIPIVREGAE